MPTDGGKSVDEPPPVPPSKTSANGWGPLGTLYPDTVTLHESLGNTVYLQVMQQADLVIGNSSSGLIEAPAMGVPTVNIGPRQDGRLRAESVVDCENTVEDISRALSRGLSEGMKDKAAKQYLPYGSGNATAAILVELKSQPLPSPVRKKFYERAAP